MKLRVCTTRESLVYSFMTTFYFFGIDVVTYDVSFYHRVWVEAIKTRRYKNSMDNFYHKDTISTRRFQNVAL